MVDPAIDGAHLRCIGANKVALACYEAGHPGGPTVVLSHGFPELAFSWRWQIPALAAAGYHVLAPDQRGYGGSDRPASVTEYDIFHLTDDLVGLLDATDVERAVFVGHDWGGLVVWQLALLHPVRVAGVVGINTPYLPRLPVLPTTVFRTVGGDNHYILYFQEPGVADAVLAADTRLVFSRLMRRGIPPEELQEAIGSPMSFAESLTSAPEIGEAFLTDDELSIYVDAFERTGFTGALNWYRNFDRNWEMTPHLDGAHIGVPSLMVTAEWDPVLPPAMAAGMGAWIADLETHMIERCGHWTQQERPGELNLILLDWLQRRFPAETRMAAR